MGTSRLEQQPKKGYNINGLQENTRSFSRPAISDCRTVHFVEDDSGPVVAEMCLPADKAVDVNVA